MRISQYLGALVLLWPAVISWADEPPAEPEPAAATQPDRTSQRFEGYLFLDVEGKPLPIQSDEEIERFLAEAEIVEISLVGSGITIPRKVVLQGDGFRAHAIFKDVNVERHKVTERINRRNRFSLDWFDSHRFDNASYKLDRILGLNRIPPGVPRKVGGENGTITIWLEKTINDEKRSRRLKIEPPDYRRWHQQYLLMRIFDNLVANRDSNLGNLLIDPNWRLWFVDCTRCYGKTKALYYPIKEFEHCERGFWEGLKNLNAETAQEELSPYLDKGEIKSLLARRDAIIQHFQKLIDEKGAERVLYVIPPPNETAPWGNE